MCDNLAVPELGVVAYLGMPLATADGQVLGSLCAIDTRPRSWTAEDAAALRDLAGLAMSEVSLRGLALELEAWLRAEGAAREAAQARLREEAAAREAAQLRLARTHRLEALEQLAGGVAHDFANVLQAVQGGVRLAAGRLDRDPAAARHLLDLVGATTGRGASVTRRLLAFAPFTEAPADPFSRARLRAARRYSVTLAPKQTVRPSVCSYSLEEWAFFGSFKADLYVYGEATYRDTVNPAETHRVEFCTRLYDLRFSDSPFNPGPFAMSEECERHNCRDEECAAQDAAPPPRSERTAF